MYQVFLSLFLVTGMILFSISIDSHAEIEEELLPPLKQMKSGIPSYNVICKEGLVRIFKIHTANPSCVTDSSVDKLLQRGWIKPELPDVQFLTEKIEYQKGEHIAITMKNLGPSTLWQSGNQLNFVIVDENGGHVKIFGGGGMYGSKIEFNPDDGIYYTWNQMNNENEFLVESGEYTIKTELRDYTGPYTPTKTIIITD